MLEGVGCSKDVLTICRVRRRVSIHRPECLARNQRLRWLDLLVVILERSGWTVQCELEMYNVAAMYLSF